uniref:Reverse transcriptase domain-containing protein n=1 Tax=Haemonchus contortus TaxID=6289 RepID=A0A7I4Z6G4_HAECO
MLDSGIVPKDWLSSHTILIHKKGARDILANYRPIALLSTMLKVFSRVILNRIRHILNMNTGKEQAGFREGFSTIDQIHVITQLAERCREYRIPLCYLFIDFKKAFDTVEHQAVLNALTAFGVPRRYVEMIRKCNTSCFTDVNLYGNPTRIPNTTRSPTGRGHLPDAVFCCSRDSDAKRPDALRNQHRRRKASIPNVC